MRMSWTREEQEESENYMNCVICGAKIYQYVEDEEYAEFGTEELPPPFGSGNPPRGHRYAFCNKCYSKYRKIMELSVDQALNRIRDEHHKALPLRTSTGKMRADSHDLQGVFFTIRETRTKDGLYVLKRTLGEDYVAGKFTTEQWMLITKTIADWMKELS
jgi:hypothetical protein